MSIDVHCTKLVMRMDNNSGYSTKKETTAAALEMSDFIILFHNNRIL